MTNKTYEQPTAIPRCWSCKKQVGQNDHFCPHCGANVRCSSPDTQLSSVRLDERSAQTHDK
jgi:rRNA maturation endonuclease Nob1